MIHTNLTMLSACCCVNQFRKCKSTYQRGDARDGPTIVWARGGVRGGVGSMNESRNAFHETHAMPPREQLLQSRIADLNLRLEGSRLERLVDRLYGELADAGLTFRPVVYLSDEWGCPDRVPIIGVPFYLATPELTRLEGELMDGVEAETDGEILRYLRHEAGHAFNYAYRLYDDAEWTALFGPFLRPYPDDYTPNPFSRRFVRHLPGWYAQKHPDEDFAETFAVWLDQASRWREAYSDWECLSKLQYVEQTAKRIDGRPPPITADNYDTQEEFLTRTMADRCRVSSWAPTFTSHALDAPLRDIFSSAEPGPTASAAELLKRHRRAIVASAYYWTGLNEEVIRGLVRHLEERATALDLMCAAENESRLIEVMAFITVLCMNRLHTGEFFQR